MRTLGRMLVALPLVAALVGVAAPAAVAKPVRSFTFTAEAGAHPVNGRSGQWTPPDAEVDVHEFEPVHDHPDPPGLGQLSALDARFEHHCGSATAPALRGEIRYRA